MSDVRPAAINIVKTPLPHFQLTIDKVAVICDAIKMGMTFEEASKALGIGPRVIARVKRDVALLYQEDPRTNEFSAAYKEILNELIVRIPQAESEFEKQLVTVLSDKALAQGPFNDIKPDADLALRILERRRPETWGKQTTVVNKNMFEKGGGKVDYTRATTAELEAIIEGEISEEQTVTKSE